ncbi:MAG: phosphate acyltransferase PlsX [Verrucomicrobia bacterium]|nr:phosphate acyltransferase PlsX [Verrucomicrobiota bacterium]
MRIVVDVMGGDHGCGVIVEGVKLALNANRKITELYLVGDQAQIKPALTRSQLQDARVKIVHTVEVLTMEDKPVEGLRRKKDCSIARAMELVKNGKAEAVISPGNTGGIFAAATFKLGRLPGVDRGGIATVIPGMDNEFVLLDSGANVECKPLHLLHYAVMGNVYSREILGYPKPRVGVLSIGTEDSKGNELTLEAFQLCKQVDLNFVGNVEGHDLFNNRVEVVVCDGFVGNIVLKTCESLATGIFAMLKRELLRNPKRKLGALLAQNAFRTIKRRMDPDAHGGGLLLGFNGIVLKAHGSARERAIMNAVRIASETIQHNVTGLINQEIARANELLARASPSLPHPVPA